MKLTGAAILVSRGMKVLQAAPAAYPYRSAAVSRRMRFGVYPRIFFSFLVLASVHALVGCERLPDSQEIEKRFPCKMQIKAHVASVQGLADFDNDSLRGLSAALGPWRTLDGIELELQGTKVTGPGLQTVPGMHRLHALNLSALNIKDDDLVHLRSLPKLRRLVLDSNADITGKGLAYLSNLKELRDLGLNKTGVDDSGILQLRTLSKLEKLSLHGVDGLTDEGVQKLQETLRELKVFR